MADDRDLAAEYRKHAKTLRAVAAFEQNQKTSILLKKLANDYEETARTLESSVSDLNSGAANSAELRGKDEL